MGGSKGALQRELQQQKRFASRREEAMLGLLRTADVVRRLIAELLEPYGVTPQQYNVLRILRGAGEAGLPTLSIRDRMIEQAPGVTRLLDRLAARGWAERRRRSDDRRQVFCSLTSAGRELLERLDAPIRALPGAALGALDDEEVDGLIELLDRLRQAHAAPDPDCPQSKEKGDEPHA